MRSATWMKRILPQAEAAIANAGAPKVRGYRVDLTNPEEIRNVVSQAREDLGRISILVTNSGGPPAGGFEEASDEKWQRGYELTFLSSVRLIREVLPGMKEQKWGRIVNFTSRSLKEPIAGLMISNAMRLAVGGMAKTLAAEVAPYGITVNNICPGPTMTDRAIELAGKRGPKQNRLASRKNSRQLPERYLLGGSRSPRNLRQQPHFSPQSWRRISQEFLFWLTEVPCAHSEYRAQSTPKISPFQTSAGSLA